MDASRRKDSGVPRDSIRKGRSLSGEEQIALLTAVRDASHQMRKDFGKIDVSWGDVHRVKRGNRSWPVSGCRASGISTLRSVRYARPDDDGISYAEGGQLCTTVVVLQEGNVRSYSATPYGQSNDPDSPHHADQAEKLFSVGRLKPTWYRKADLLEHLESSKTLKWPSRNP